MNITFYTITDERNRVNKTLNNPIKYEGIFTLAYNLINPTIKIVTTEEFTSNYCYIAETNRYYFVDRINIHRNDFYEIYLTLDVLMTYKDKILNLYGTVTQSKTGLYLQGTNIAVDARTQIMNYEFEDKFNHDGEIIMVCSGYFKGDN